MLTCQAKDIVELQASNDYFLPSSQLHPVCSAGRFKTFACLLLFFACQTSAFFFCFAPSDRGFSEAQINTFVGGWVIFYMRFSLQPFDYA